MLLRNPCKNLNSYDNPFWGKSKEGPNSKKTRKGKIPKIVVSLSCSAKPLVARNPLGPKVVLKFRNVWKMFEGVYEDMCGVECLLMSIEG